MQVQYFGGIGDFAILRHLMKRSSPCRLLVSTSGICNAKVHERHFAYLRRPDDFRYLAPEVFDQLGEIVGASRAVADPTTTLQVSGLLGDAFFFRNEAPKRASS
jgi:hypothetical protein